MKGTLTELQSELEDLSSEWKYLKKNIAAFYKEHNPVTKDDNNNNNNELEFF